MEKPYFVVNDSDNAMRKAVKNLLSDARYRVYSWHLARNISTKDLFDLPTQCKASEALNMTRLLPDNPMGRFVYFGDRVSRRVFEGEVPIELNPSPVHMQCCKLISEEDAASLLTGISIKVFSK
ncbi:hypothetical protein M9H77_25136 [Catharanthus roseus]|uniref:Uncharacterized protein n=1 Tax=Catharanthus roseus TaxID=4058 RepID=A0ACC0A8L7_CATRO|nr:hypothetical protein M9H77_25136 [Catharanthus roseus]